MPILSIVVIVGLFVVLVNFIYKKFWNKNLSLTIQFSVQRAFEGESIHLTEVIVNRKWLPLPWVAAKFHISKNLIFEDEDNGNVSDNYYRNDLFSVMAYQKITRKLNFICGKRGYYRIKSIDLLSANLLASYKYYEHIKNDASLMVYPKPIDLNALDFDYKKITGSIAVRRFINPDPFEFKGVREYQPYDDFKSINFKASAKTNMLMVNMFDCTISKEIVILLNLESYSSWDDLELFERGISLAASLADYYIKESIPVSLISGSKDVIHKLPIHLGSGQSIEHLYKIFEALAMLDLTQEAEPIIEYMPQAVFSQNESQIYILISTCHDQALYQRYREIYENFNNIYWILPKFYDTKISISDETIMYWEADHE